MNMIPLCHYHPAASELGACFAADEVTDSCEDCILSETTEMDLIADLSFFASVHIRPEGSYDVSLTNPVVRGGEMGRVIVEPLFTK